MSYAGEIRISVDGVVAEILCATKEFPVLSW
jgi:hypothetical protein